MIVHLLQIIIVELVLEFVLGRYFPIVFAFGSQFIINNCLVYINLIQDGARRGAEQKAPYQFPPFNFYKRWN